MLATAPRVVIVLLLLSVFPTSISAVTNYPSNSPTLSPSFSPSFSPTFSPSVSPSFSPSVNPTRKPSRSPSRSPTKSPTVHARKLWITEIHAGEMITCGVAEQDWVESPVQVTRNGRHVKCFGENTTLGIGHVSGNLNGVIGDEASEMGDNLTFVRDPVATSTKLDISTLSVGGHHAIGISKSGWFFLIKLMIDSSLLETHNNDVIIKTGILVLWGRQMGGELGDNQFTTTASFPITYDLTSPAANATKVCAGWQHSLILDSAGNTRCMGRNTWGECGFSAGWFFLPSFFIQEEGALPRAVY